MAQDNTGGDAATPADIETLVVEYAKASKFALDAYTKGYRHAELALRAEVAARPDPIGAAWMREQAANVQVIGTIGMVGLSERVQHAIRALPLPTDADLLAEAMKLPEVAALVSAGRFLHEALTQHGENGAYIYPTINSAQSDMLAALAPFTAAKESPNIIKDTME